jgi:Rrf2 family protein
VRVSAKADYAVRALVELATGGEGTPIKGEAISTAQDIPMPFLENILSELRHSGLVQSRRGAEGGYWLSRLPREVSIADVIRAVEGPLATVRGQPPDELRYTGSAEPLARVWTALRSNVRDVLENVTLADVVANELPPNVERLLEPREAPG